MTVGRRLREEREATGIGVVAFAGACGVSKQAQGLFEKGDNLPGGAYLIEAAKLGVDVKYVLTGERGVERVYMPVNRALLAEVVEGVEAGLKQQKLRMAAAARAELVARLYEMFQGRAAPSRATILQFVQRAA